MAALAAAREQQHARLCQLPNVRGTMLGEKLVCGTPTGEKCVVVIVEDKVDRADLPRAGRIPRTLRAEGKNVATDVLAFGHFLAQAVRTCSDGRTRATVSAIARGAAGPVGITCAHALGGRDGNLATSEAISLWSPERKVYLPAGRSGPSIRHPGLGIPTDFGFADIGMFSLEYDPVLRKYAGGLAPMPLVASLQIGSAVYAETGRGRVSGYVQGIRAILRDFRCDIVVRVDPPGTFEGDSGAIWRSAPGRAMAIHAMGTAAPVGQGSAFSAAMLASRAARLLGATFLDG